MTTKQHNILGITDKEKDLWLATLRSDMYKQARSTLVNTNTMAFCCLGVLACIVPEKAKNNISLNWENLPEILPIEVEQILAKCNDRKRWNFNQISDFIEINWNQWKKQYK